MATQAVTGPVVGLYPPLQAGAIAFRFRIGVVGDWHPNSRAGLGETVAERIHQIRRLLPPSDVTPFAFTALVAIGGCVHEFEADEPRALFRHATERVDVTATTPPLDGDLRDAGLSAERYVVDHSDALVAVSDRGAESALDDDDEIIAYARSQGVPVLEADASGGGRSGVPESNIRRLRSATRLKAAREAFRRIDELNLRSLRQRRSEQVLRSEYARLAKPLEKSPILPQYRLVADWALPHLVDADVLAMRYQSRFRILVGAMHLLAALAVTAVAAQTVFAETEPKWLGFEIGLVSLLVLALLLGRGGHVHDRWIGYRSLTEAFRSAIFIVMSGAGERDAPGYSSGLRELEEPWFQRAFTEAWRHHPNVSLTDGDAPDVGRFLVESWIDDQTRYHRAVADHCLRSRNRFAWIVGILAAVTIVVATLHIARTPDAPGWENCFQFLAIALPGFGAALVGLREHGQHRLHEERSKRTANRLIRLKHEAGLVTDLGSVRRLVAQAQRVILEENLIWSGVSEFRDLEMVI